MLPQGRRERRSQIPLEIPARAAAESPARAAVRRLLTSAGVRVAVLPVSGLAALLIARTVTSEYGVEAYAIFALVANLPFLLPISDLGVGAAVTNATAALPGAARKYVAVRRKAQNVLLLVGSGVAVGSLALGALGLWPTLLGLPFDSATNWGATGALALFGAALPGAIGARELLGLRRNTTVVLVQGMTSVISLAGVSICISMDGGIGVALVLSILGLFVTNWFCWTLARLDARCKRARIACAADAGLGRKVPIWSTAVPMMVISLALPLTFQSARLVLSHISTLDEVAKYSAAAVVYLPTVSVVMVAGRSLWGDFAAARARRQAVGTLYRSALVMSTALGLAGAAGLTLLGPAFASWATAGAVAVPWELFVALGTIVLLQAVQLPAGMLLTDAAGLRFQAATTISMAVVSLPLSFYLGGLWGAIGPAVGTSIALVVAQTVPSLLRARRVVRRQGRETKVDDFV